jgi:hypothetical protein
METICDIRVLFKNCISSNDYTLKISKVEKIIPEDSQSPENPEISKETKYKIHYTINTSPLKTLEFTSKTFETFFVKKLCLTFVPKSIFVTYDGVESLLDYNHILKRTKEDAADPNASLSKYQFYAVASSFVKNYIVNV